MSPDIKTENYFSIENLNEIIGIDSHLKFVSELLHKYDWSKKEKQALEQQFCRIKEKQEDELLNVSVIGEFSSGKSTFINSILNDDLLSSCALQGTTVANTVIEYSQNYGLEIVYKRRKKSSIIDCPDIEALKDKIRYYTTDSVEGRNIRTVKIRIPAGNLKDRFRIIDTPGTNSLELWHEEVTKTAIGELSDLCVILIDSTKLFPESFCNFITENVGNVLSRCVFVLTKFDLIPPDERDKLLKYSKIKVKKTFGIEESVILPYSSTVIAGGNTDSEMYAISVDSLRQLLLYTAKNKTFAQVRKLIAFTDVFYDLSSSYASRISKRNSNMLQKLNEAKQMDFYSFAQRCKESLTEEYVNLMNSGRTDILKKITDDTDEIMKSINLNISNARNIQQIEGFLKNQLDPMCNYVRCRAYKYIDNAVPVLVEYLENQIEKFRNEFSGLFRELELLEFDFSHINKPVERNYESSIQNWVMVSSYIGDEKSKSNLAFGGGALAGAVVGSVVPVVGTIIGGIAGYFSGGLFAPKIDDVKLHTKQQLDVSLKKFFDDIYSEVDSEMQTKIQSFAIYISEEIDRYHNEYTEIIELRIAEENQKKTEIENCINTINCDLKEINNRKFVLDSLFRKLDSLFVKENK